MGNDGKFFAGEFETHFTIRLGDPSQLASLREWGARRKMKCVHIVLARGDTASQPMMTRRSSGTLVEELAAAQSVSVDLRRDGFDVIRVKIEAAPWNRDIPATDNEATDSDSRHFEHHVKLLLPPTTDLASLAELAIRHGAHLSRNALRQRDDGLLERFVTQRRYGVGKSTASQDLNDLVAALRSADFQVDEVEQEYVVYDSNASIDAGWLSESR